MSAAPRARTDKTPTRILDDAGVAEIASIPGVAYVEPNVIFRELRESEPKSIEPEHWRRKHSQRCFTISAILSRQYDLRAEC